MSAAPATAQSDWLEDCVGFAVESGARPIGRVAEVLRDAESGRPVALVLRSGLAGWRRLLVPVDNVAGVLPSSGRIFLNGSWPPSADMQAASPLRPKDEGGARGEGRAAQPGLAPPAL